MKTESIEKWKSALKAVEEAIDFTPVGTTPWNWEAVSNAKGVIQEIIATHKPEPPKPREWWIRTEKEPWEDFMVFDHPVYGDGIKLIHVREVLPEEEGKA